DLRGRGPIRTRFDRSRQRGFSRFVGRARELAWLDATLDETKEGRPKIVLITAEPGAGKSRLCHELVERRRDGMVYYSHAPSHVPMLLFHAIAELARSLSGISRNTSAVTVRGAVEQGLESAQSHDPIALAFWLELLGAPDPAAPHSELEPEARRARLFQS